MKRKMSVLFLVISCTLSFSQAKPNCACCTEVHQQFNFWVGEWTVTTANGQPAGTNSIKKLQNQCVLQENWLSATQGYTGTSYNFYNAQTQQWEQIWIDNSGLSLHLKGNLQDGQMVLKSEPQPNPKGQLVYNQITWTNNPDGTVRQLWEVFTEGEATTIAFDGLYRRKK